MMHEVVSLAAYGWSRYRVVGWSLIVAVAIAEVAILAMLRSFDGGDNVRVSEWFVWRVAITVLGMCCVGWVLVIMAMFSFSGLSRLCDTDSGFDAWLLRQPIPTWKLAVIACGLLTLGPLLACGLATVNVYGLTRDGFPWMESTLTLSTCGILLSAVAWRPVDRDWHRVAVLMVMIPVLYLGVISPALITDEYAVWQNPLRIAVLVVYVAAVWVAYRCLQAARSVRPKWVATHSDRAQEDSQTPAWSHPDADRTVAGVRSVMRRYDQSRTMGERKRMAWVALLPGVLFALLMIFTGQPSMEDWVVALSFSLLTSVFTTSHLMESGTWGPRSSLPGWFTVTPIRSQTIARHRLTWAIGHATWVLTAMMLLITAVMLALPGPRSAILLWWMQTNDPVIVAMPLRIMGCSIAAAYLIAVSLTSWIVSIQLIGRQWVLLATTAVVVTAMMASLVGFLVWFDRQDDWESVQASVRWASQYVDVALALTLAAKWIVGVIVAACVLRSDQLSFGQVIGVALAWVAAVIVIGLGWSIGWPLAKPQPSTLLSITAIAVPLSPWLLAPLAVHWNRHRRVGV